MKSYRERFDDLTTVTEKHQTGGGVIYTCKLYGFDTTTPLAVGISKLNPKDKDNEEVGVSLAMSRAFSNYAKSLERRANGLVKHADDMKARSLKPKGVEHQPIHIPLPDGYSSATLKDSVLSEVAVPQ